MRSPQQTIAIFTMTKIPKVTDYSYFSSILLQKLVGNHDRVLVTEIEIQGEGNTAQKVHVHRRLFQDAIEVARVAMYLAGQPCLAAFLLFQFRLYRIAYVVFF